jgi:hypothetical protein
MTCSLKLYVGIVPSAFEPPALRVIRISFNCGHSDYSFDVKSFLYNNLTLSNAFAEAHAELLKTKTYKRFLETWTTIRHKLFKRILFNDCYDKVEFTPCQWIIDCINEFLYEKFIEPKEVMNYNEFLNSEFKIEMDEKTQKIHDKYYFDRISGKY